MMIKKLNNNKIKEYINKIILISFGVLSSIGIWYAFGSSNKETVIFSVILTPILYLFFKDVKTKNLKDNKENKKLKIMTLIFAFLLAMVIIIGRQITDYQGIYIKNLSIYTFFAFLGLIILLYNILKWGFNILISKEITLIKYDLSIKIFFIIFLIILICWIPYLIAQYPAHVEFDAAKQIRMIRGEIPLADAHPITHTMLIKLCMNIAGGNLLLYSLIQMISLALIFAFACFWLLKKGLPKKYVYIIMLYFALNPLHGEYSVTITKDILFSGFMLLLTIVLMEIILSKGAALKKLSWFSLFVFSIFTVGFFRNNGPLVLLALFILMLISFKKYWKQILIPALIFILVLAGVKGPLLSYLNIAPSPFTESVGIPLQQIARVIATGKEITPEQEEFIDSIISIETIKKNYNPHVVDTIKSPIYGADFKHSVLENNKAEFFEVWFSLLKKYPKTYIDAYLDNSYGFWFPLKKSFVSDWKNGYIENAGFINETNDNAFSNALGKITQEAWRLNVPSLCAYMTLFFAVIVLFKKKRLKACLPFAPVLLVWLSILIAAPIATSLRYVYCFFTTIPVLASYVFLDYSKAD